MIRHDYRWFRIAVFITFNYGSCLFIFFKCHRETVKILLLRELTHNLFEPSAIRFSPLTVKGKKRS